jgi:hypothetical protein
MVISATDKGAEEFGGKIKAPIEEANHLGLNSVKISEDSKAKGRFKTNRGGSLLAAGILSGITGAGAD